MAKGGILSDTFEQLAELGQSTAKKTVKSMAQIVNPFPNESNESNKSHSPEANAKKNHTSLDFKKLQENFKDKEKMKVEALRNRLFQNVRREDEKSLDREKMAKEEKKRNEEYLVQEKKRKDQQQKIQDQQGNVPTGKAKRGFMTRKKSSEQQHVENKPASGKQ